MRQLIYGMMIACALSVLPMSAQAGNQEMVESVAAMLQASDLADGCELGIKYQNQTIWLEGAVPTQARKMAIEACVFHVKGVDKVVNNLEVASDTSRKEAVADAMVDAEVQAAAFQRGVLRNNSAPIRSQNSQPQTVCVSQPAPAQNLQSTLAQAPQPTLADPSRQVGAGVPRGARIISDQVISVQEITNMASPVLPVDAVPAPIVTSDYVASAPGTMPMRNVNYTMASTSSRGYGSAGVQGAPLPMNAPAYAPRNGGVSMRYDQPHMPRHAWPAYASYPNTAAVQYPKNYSAKAWPYIGPVYPYPQVPDGWRKSTLEWHDGYWRLNFDDGSTKGPCSGLFRMNP